jgi:hypothetical protein
MNLVIYTQTNATTRNPGNRCVQWQVTTGDELQTRNWSINWQDDPGTLVTGWRVVADHIVNRDPPGSGTPVPAFTLDTSQAAFGDRLVKVVILANQNPSHGRTVRIEASVTARNTQYGYPNTVCDTIPPA